MTISASLLTCSSTCWLPWTPCQVWRNWRRYLLVQEAGLGSLRLEASSYLRQFDALEWPFAAVRSELTGCEWSLVAAALLVHLEPLDLQFSSPGCTVWSIHFLDSELIGFCCCQHASTLASFSPSPIRKVHWPQSSQSTGSLSLVSKTTALAKQPPLHDAAWYGSPRSPHQNHLPSPRSASYSRLASAAIRRNSFFLVLPEFLDENCSLILLWRVQ